MMNGQEKSDFGVVAEKPANKGGEPSAERVEPKAGAEGNAEQQSTRRAQDRESVSQALDRIRHAASARFVVKHPRWEPDARIGPRPDLCGGRSAMNVPTAINSFRASLLV
jgi:hypothetical protein